MKKYIFSFIIIGLIVFKSHSQQKSPYFNTEIEKWKIELVANGEVGNPCRKDNDVEKWMKANPNAYFGLQKIQSIESDFNSDGIIDGLFFFPAVNCVGGNGYGSNFAMLVYSYKGQILTNKNITKIIEHKIEDSFIEKGIYDVYKIYIYYNGLGKSIVGKYSVWTDDDASCCPSIKGTFNYNPINFSLTTKGIKK
ncbi:MAG TPA: hypothetical protein DER05_02115 [Lutibacter sp.]|nr:hypothetical protein [Lutibacter sp.]